MPKSKRGAALFDLLAEESADGSDKLKVPPWWKRGRGPGQTGTETDKVKPAPADAARQPDEVGDTTPEPSSAPEPSAARPRFFEFDGACVRVSFTTKSASIAVFAALVVLLGAFELGSRIGEASGLRTGYTQGRESYTAEVASDIELARNQPPATHLVEDLLAQPSEAGGYAGFASGGDDRSYETRWVKGNDYIVAQEFLADRLDDARRAQEFLSQHGVATELIRLSSRSLQLVTAQGYNRRDAVQKRLGDELLAKVHAAGEKYFAAGGGYRLKGYFKTLKNDTW